jgi:hypothetical protein
MTSASFLLKVVVLLELHTSRDERETT